MYYQKNAHGDVVRLADTAGKEQRRYSYDAFGNERKQDSKDNNPFRYCGEYYDKETGSLYLRARYYNPAAGRFITADTHWNPENMICGDNPVKWNERQAGSNDPLGLNNYTYKPDITAIRQSGNLYVYGMNNPLMYTDPTGELAYPGQIHNLVVDHVASNYGFHREQTISYDFGWGRADLISASGEVWDVKRDKPRQIASGVAQVSKYTQNTWKNSSDTVLSVGGYINPGSFVVTLNVDTYYVSYRYAEGGVIAYDYNKVTDWDKVGEIATGTAMIAGAAFLIYITGGAATPVLVPMLAR